MMTCNRERERKRPNDGHNVISSIVCEQEGSEGRTTFLQCHSPAKCINVEAEVTLSVSFYHITNYLQYFFEVLAISKVFIA